VPRVPFRWTCSTRPTGEDRVTLPAMCPHHSGVYATRAGRLAHRVHHPGRGHKALEREARTVAGQCPECIATR
jgi:hypothetical protein